MRSWLTVKDVCSELKVGKSTWYRWVNNEDIPTPDPIRGIGRMVRYRREDFLAFRDLLNAKPVKEVVPKIVRDGFIYFIGCNNGYIKIGFASDLKRRLSELQTGSPYKLEVIAVFPGTTEHETKIHRKLKSVRHRGEWFHPHWSITDLIKAFEAANNISEVLD